MDISMTGPGEVLIRFIDSTEETLIQKRSFYPALPTVDDPALHRLISTRASGRNQEPAR